MADLISQGSHHCGAEEERRRGGPGVMIQDYKWTVCTLLVLVIQQRKSLEPISSLTRSDYLFPWTELKENVSQNVRMSQNGENSLNTTNSTLGKATDLLNHCHFDKKRQKALDFPLPTDRGVWTSATSFCGGDNNFPLLRWLIGEKCPEMMRILQILEIPVIPC